MALVVAALVVGGCGSDDDTPAAVVVVAVEATGCVEPPARGTGFVTDGLVVTTAHTVAGRDEVTVDGSTATVVAIDTDRDVAVLRPTGPEPASTPLVEPGGATTLVTLDATTSAPLDDEVTIRITDIYDEEVTERRGFRVDEAIEPGDSGAPIVSPDGVVAMVFSRAQSVDPRGYATSASEIAAVVATAGDDGAPAVPCR